jgi:hypothetical protein
VPGKRPINADLPAVPEEVPASPKPPRRASDRVSEIDHTGEGSKSDARGRRHRRRPVPAALKAIAGLVVVAVVFLVAAIVGGGSSHRSGAGSAARPTAPLETPAPEAVEEIGYPSVATNNTTRIGGPDPASVAAAVALAVYPSRTPAQRPAAVTLVDEDDWQGAVAGAVLMAAPVQAPLLVTSGGDLPDTTSQALEALAPQGGTGSGGTQAFAIGSAAPPEGLRTTAIGGAGPAAVAARIEAVRDKLLGEPPRQVVLVSGDAPQFALPAAAWAARSGDPVLFTGADKLPTATATALARHAKAPIYALGPPAAISSGVLREVAHIDPRVHRVSGEDAVENAIALARYANGGFGWNVNDPGHGFVIARDDEPLVAAVAAPLSASGTWGPLLLTDDGDTLPKALREYLLSVKPGYTTDPTRAFYNHVWVIGDQEAIDVNQQAEIDQLAELAKIGQE